MGGFRLGHKSALLRDAQIFPVISFYVALHSAVSSWMFLNKVIDLLHCVMLRYFLLFSVALRCAVFIWVVLG